MSVQENFLSSNYAPHSSGDVKSFIFNYKYSIYTENCQFLRVTLVPDDELVLLEVPELTVLLLLDLVILKLVVGLLLILLSYRVVKVLTVFSLVVWGQCTQQQLS